ncbi:hypothetical protein [Dokdonia sp. Asnod2-E02]|uniref:hypothetical protein n=1 Tax=Dokdonia sp. Asnod2-E02 TaxID=3160574 RepID=UPI00386B2E71
MNYLTKQEVVDLLEEETQFIEIPVFNPELELSENLETGTKYFIIPIDSNEIGHYENRRLIAPGTKIISGIKDMESFEYSEMMNLIVDYATMFGTRLNRFMKYNPKFFTCDERVFFESLLMKYRYFKYKPFFLSYETIFQEIGIKKDRAVSIRKKFEAIGILESSLVTSKINNRPSQITYYSLHLEKIIKLLPNIFKDEDDVFDIRGDIEKYLKGKNI